MKESFSKMFEQQMEENPGALKKARKEKRNREFDRGYPDEETMWAEQDSYNIMRSVLTRVDLYVRTLEDIALREIEIISQEAKEHSIQVGKSTSWKMERLMKKWAKITETEHRGIIQEEEDTEKGLHIHPVPLSENFIENFLFISDTSYNERDEQELNKVYFAIHTGEDFPKSKELGALGKHTEYLDIPINSLLPQPLTGGNLIAFSISYQHIGEEKILSGIYLLKRREAVKKFLDHWAQTDIGNPLLHRQIFLYVHGLFPDNL